MPLHSKTAPMRPIAPAAQSAPTDEPRETETADDLADVLGAAVPALEVVVVPGGASDLEAPAGADVVPPLEPTLVPGLAALVPGLAALVPGLAPPVEPPEVTQLESVPFWMVNLSVKN